MDEFGDDGVLPVGVPVAGDVVPGGEPGDGPVVVVVEVAGPVAREPPVSSACGVVTVVDGPPGVVAVAGGVVGLGPLDGGVRFGPLVGVATLGVEGFTVAGPPPVRETFELDAGTVTVDGPVVVIDVGPAVGAGPVVVIDAGPAMGAAAAVAIDGEPAGPVLTVAGARATGVLVTVLAAGAVFIGAEFAGAETGEAGCMPVPLCAGASTGGATEDRVTSAGAGVTLACGVLVVGDAWLAASDDTAGAGWAAAVGDAAGCPPE